MTQTFTASITREGPWFIAQCRKVDVASQGETEEEALANLREALELHVTPPTARAISADLSHRPAPDITVLY